MSQIVASEPSKLRKNERKDRLIASLLQGHSLTDIATELGVNRRTLQRDFNEWREDEGFTEWAYTNWIQLFTSLKINKPDKAFQGLTLIILKTMKEKVEAKIEAGIIIKGFDLGVAERNNDTVPASPETSNLPPQPT